VERRKAVKKFGISIASIIAAPAILDFATSCQVRQKNGDKIANSRLFLDTKQDQMVAEISELIIPATDTPGAKEAQVNEFIDVMLQDCYYKEDQQSFIEGLERLEKESLKNYQKPFLKASTKQKSYLLKKEASSGDNSNRPTRFFQIVKELTLLGYFTSEVGATQALKYVPVPGKFKGCIALKEGQKAWAI
jgi:hypothetical protein